MILKELDELYKRLVASGESVPRRGWSLQKTGYRIVLRPDGTLVRMEDAREAVTEVKKAKKASQKEDTTVTRLVPPQKMVPGGAHPPGPGISPGFLWDNPAYLLGCVQVKDRALEYFTALKKKHLEFEKEINSPAFSAVCRFLEQWDPAECDNLCRDGIFRDKSMLQSNGVFQVLGEKNTYVHEDPAVVEWWQKGGGARWKGEKKVEGFCLVRGETLPLARLHEPGIKGVRNAQSSGAKLVSFQPQAFRSYGKEQGLNSPVSEEAAFSYCNALNYLLQRRKQKFQLADATTVFWTDAPPQQAEEWECMFATVIDSKPLEAQDDALVKRVSDRLDKIVHARPFTPEERQAAFSGRFFILGLSPNNTRLSVRFFMESTMDELVDRLVNHFEAMRLQPRGGLFRDPELISPLMILLETVTPCETQQKTEDNIPPSYSRALMKAILLQTPYPDSVALAILRRIRTDCQASLKRLKNGTDKGILRQIRAYRPVNYVRCAYLKAWLSRKKIHYSIQPMLDTTNTQPGYVLGRLLAVLQKTQEEAMPDLKRTIVDSFYGSASTSPGSVFPRVLRMHVHHLDKLSEGAKVSRKKLVQTICAQLQQFPAHLNPEQQGLFALGYYHQMQDLFTPQNQNNPQ